MRSVIYLGSLIHLVAACGSEVSIDALEQIPRLMPLTARVDNLDDPSFGLKLKPSNRQGSRKQGHLNGMQDKHEGQGNKESQDPTLSFTLASLAWVYPGIGSFGRRRILRLSPPERRYADVLGLSDWPRYPDSGLAEPKGNKLHDLR